MLATTGIIALYSLSLSLIRSKEAAIQKLSLSLCSLPLLEGAVPTDLRAKTSVSPTGWEKTFKKESMMEKAPSVGVEVYAEAGKASKKYI